MQTRSTPTPPLSSRLLLPDDLLAHPMQDETLGSKHTQPPSQNGMVVSVAEMDRGQLLGSLMGSTCSRIYGTSTTSWAMNHLAEFRGRSSDRGAAEGVFEMSLTCFLLLLTIHKSVSSEWASPSTFLFRTHLHLSSSLANAEKATERKRMNPVYT